MIYRNDKHTIYYTHIVNSLADKDLIIELHIFIYKTNKKSIILLIYLKTASDETII